MGKIKDNEHDVTNKLYFFIEVHVKLYTRIRRSMCFRIHL